MELFLLGSESQSIMDESLIGLAKLELIACEAKIGHHTVQTQK